MENKGLATFLLCLKTIQDEQGLNLSEIADKLNVSLSYLSNVKHGKKPVSTKILFDIKQLSSMTATKAINKYLEPYQHQTKLKEPPSEYRSGSLEKEIIEHLMVESSLKTSQIEKLIQEISLNNKTLAILAAKIK
jgi:transcriptional regulator with XRE-family HTH domain